MPQQMNTRTSDARRAAIGAGVVAAFERAIGMEYDSAGMSHRVGMGLLQYLDIVTG